MENKIMDSEQTNAEQESASQASDLATAPNSPDTPYESESSDFFRNVMFDSITEPELLTSMATFFPEYFTGPGDLLEVSPEPTLSAVEPCPEAQLCTEAEPSMNAHPTIVEPDITPWLSRDQPLSSRASQPSSRSSSRSRDDDETATSYTSADDASQREQDDQDVGYASAEFDWDDVATEFGIDTIRVHVIHHTADDKTVETELDIDIFLYHMGIAQGHAFIGFEREENAEEIAAREKHKNETAWMGGWLAKKNPGKYKASAGRKFVDGKWVDAGAEQDRFVVVEWKRCEFREGGISVLHSGVEEREEKRQSGLSDPPLHYKVRLGGARLVAQGEAALSGAGRAPLRGGFSEEEERRFECKRVVGRGLEMMG